MKDAETLQKILDRKIDSLQGICDTLDGAYMWFEVFARTGFCEENKNEFWKTCLAFSKTYEDYIRTKTGIEALQYVLDSQKK